MSSAWFTRIKTKDTSVLRVRSWILPVIQGHCPRLSLFLPLSVCVFRSLSPSRVLSHSVSVSHARSLSVSQSFSVCIGVLRAQSVGGSVSESSGEDRLSLGGRTCRQIDNKGTGRDTLRTRVCRLTRPGLFLTYEVISPKDPNSAFEMH